MKSKINIVSLGCPRNLVDSESIIGRLQAKGADIVDIAKADTVIINTCAFIKEAKEESIDIILDAIELKKQGQIKKILVSGCLSQRYPQELAREFKEIDAIAGRIEFSCNRNRKLLTPPHYAYLKICEGCFNSCSFCVIPKIKGKFKSRDVKSILKEVQILDKAKISELNIVGQDITCFGMDSHSKYRLYDLISDISEVSENISWIRLLYMNPQRIDKKLIELIKADKKVCKYIDLPIQHINDRILKLMNRRTTKKQIHSLINRIRREIPEVAIRTSVIVGFPTESDAEFGELLDFIEEMRFERLGAFIYSHEEGTPAYDFSGHIRESVKRGRFDALMQAQLAISKDLNHKKIGKIIDVMIDKEENGMYIGRSYADAPEVDGSVLVQSNDKLFPGDIVKVKLTESHEYDLVGEKTSS